MTAISVRCNAQTRVHVFLCVRPNTQVQTVASGLVFLTRLARRPGDQNLNVVNNK